MPHVMRYTPGPWWVSGNFVRAEDGAICKMSHESAITYAAQPSSLEDAANANLISLAPDLLHAVNLAYHLLQSYGPPRDNSTEQIVLETLGDVLVRAGIH